MIGNPRTVWATSRLAGISDDSSSLVMAMALQTETIQVSGVRCERCVHRLAATLRDHEGLEQANANLMGLVTLAWDDERTDREALTAALARGGFHEVAAPV
jgi:hypothetical protein